MTRAQRWCVYMMLLVGGLALVAGCSRFPGDVDFSAEPTTGKAPLSVQFTPIALGGTASYVWSFGDGTTSRERSPEHEYSRSGNYTVTLLVVPRSGEPTAITKPDYIRVTSGGFGGGRLTPIYWTEAGVPYVQRCLRNGTYVVGLDMWIDGPADVAVSGGIVYWTDTVRGQVSTHNLSTSLNTILADGRDTPYGIAVNDATGRIYWTERYDVGLGLDGMVMQVFTNGTGASSVRQTMGQVFDIAFDPAHNTLYWTQHFSVLPRDFGEGSYGIRARTTMGSESQPVRGLDYIPYGIAVDSVNGKLYWTGNGAIHRCNTDGSSVQTLISEADSPRGIAVDAEEGKIYWGEDGRIRRANLNGSGVETILAGLGQVIGLTLGE